MIFWIVVALFVAGFVWMIIDDWSPFASVLTVVSFTIACMMLFFIIGGHVGVDGTIAKNNTRYEMLTYQLENDIYDNDNDLGKRNLMEDIQDWNETLAYKQAVQDDFWIGIFFPNIYDQFEFIEPEVPSNKNYNS